MILIWLLIRIGFDPNKLNQIHFIPTIIKKKKKKGKMKKKIDSLIFQNFGFQKMKKKINFRKFISIKKKNCLKKGKEIFIFCFGSIK